jgi:hypothetical protein
LLEKQGREKRESKAELRARGVESSDRADALIGAIALAQDRQVNWAECRESKRRDQTPRAGSALTATPATSLDRISGGEKGPKTHTLDMKSCPRNVSLMTRRKHFPPTASFTPARCNDFGLEPCLKKYQ